MNEFADFMVAKLTPKFRIVFNQIRRDHPEFPAEAVKREMMTDFISKLEGYARSSGKSESQISEIPQIISRVMDAVTADWGNNA